MIEQKRTSNPIRFVFHADAEMVGCGQIRQRIAAKKRRLGRGEMQAQNNKLARPEERELPIGWRQDERHYALALVTDTRDSHLAKARPRWCLFIIRESRISGPGF